MQICYIIGVSFGRYPKIIVRIFSDSCPKTLMGTLFTAFMHVSIAKNAWIRVFKKTKHKQILKEENEK